MTLKEIFDKNKSDKGSIWADGSIGGHNYEYENIVPRSAEVLLEIGIGANLPCPAGSASHYDIPRHGFNGSCGSIRAWLEWLEDGDVYGFDLGESPQDLLQNKRFHFTKGDQGIEKDIVSLKNNIPECDIIIDDGSHFSEHHFLCLNILWEKVKLGGFYVIEDAALRWGKSPHAIDVLPKDNRFYKFIGLHNQGIVLKKSN